MGDNLPFVYFGDYEVVSYCVGSHHTCVLLDNNEFFIIVLVKLIQF